MKLNEPSAETKKGESKRRFGWRWAVAAVTLLFGWFCFCFLVPPAFQGFRLMRVRGSPFLASRYQFAKFVWFCARMPFCREQPAGMSIQRDAEWR